VAGVLAAAWVAVAGSPPTVRALGDAGRPVRVSWQPPPTSTRSSGVLRGGAEIDAASKRPVQSGQSTPGWLLWVVPPTDGREVTFRNRKIGPELEVLTAGVIPLYARRSDGWLLNVYVPMSEPLPSWLVDALGGRWSKGRTAA